MSSSPTAPSADSVAAPPAVPRASTSRSPVWGLLALSTAAFTAVATEQLPAGLLPQMSASLHVAVGPVGFLVTGYAAASVGAAIPVTAALRGLARRPVLIGVLTGFALCNVVTAISASYPLTFAARLLAGAMGGTMWAMLAGYAARMVPAERRGRAIAIVLAGITVALALGLPAGTALAAVAGWRASFATLAALAAILAGWVAWRVPNFPGERAGERLPLRAVAALPGLRVVLAVTLLLILGHQAMYTYLTVFAQHGGFGHTSLVLLVFGLATVAGVWIVGTLVDRHLRPALLGALTLIAAALLALGLSGGGSAVLLTAVALWGTAFGAAPTLLQTALVDVSGTSRADLATSMLTTIYNVGIAAGSLAGGVVLDGAGARALPWTAFPLVAAALVAVSAARRQAFPAQRRLNERAVVPNRRAAAPHGRVTVSHGSPGHLSGCPAR
jgi:predicted MFS family arabinose efflux permease